MWTLVNMRLVGYRRFYGARSWLNATLRVYNKLRNSWQFVALSLFDRKGSLCGQVMIKTRGPGNAR